MEEEIHFESRMGDGSQADQGLMGKLFSAGKRALTGESIFMTHFTNHSRQAKRKVAFAAPFPGKIIPMDLAGCAARSSARRMPFSARPWAPK